MTSETIWLRIGMQMVTVRSVLNSSTRCMIGWQAVNFQFKLPGTLWAVAVNIFGCCRICSGTVWFFILRMPQNLCSCLLLSLRHTPPFRLVLNIPNWHRGHPYLGPKGVISHNDRHNVPFLMLDPCEHGDSTLCPFAQGQPYLAGKNA